MVDAGKNRRMRKLNRFTGLLAAMFALTSTGSLRAEGARVEAEDMKLAHYQVANQGNTAFIKLTNSSGVAAFQFELPSGRYDIEARYLSEKAGQNTYAMYLNGVQIVAWLGKDRDEQWHLLSEQKWHAPKNIAINSGDELRIESLSETGSLAILDYIAFIPSSRSGSATRQNIVTIVPEEYEPAFQNPLKGFRAGFEQDHEYGTLTKSYIKWNEIENVASDGLDKIKTVCDAKWHGCEAKNMKIIPRVYLDWPRKKSGWPEDMKAGDYTSDHFKQRALALIQKLGQVWDQDSRVAYVEMGLIGQWGEMEWPDTSDEIKEAIAAQFAASFKHKLVMVRWPNTYNDDLYNFGYYWDSWAHHDQRYYGFNLRNISPKWKTAVIGGEAAYDWGNSAIQPGNNPDESLAKAVHRDYILDEIRSLHGNHMGWLASYDHSNRPARAGAIPVQKALGYRFVISEATYPKRININTEFTVSFKVKNTGASPIYYNWPVELSLLDPKTKQPVWKSVYTDIDIRKWMPGDQWDGQNDRYAIPPEVCAVHQSFVVSNVPTGEYIFALAILDPAGGRPSVRFAIQNYYKGGRHPLGRVGVNLQLETYSISGFDDIQSDRSLSYDKVVKQ